MTKIIDFNKKRLDNLIKKLAVKYHITQGQVTTLVHKIVEFDIVDFKHIETEFDMFMQVKQAMDESI